jgi:chromosome segregation ATPase
MKKILWVFIFLFGAGIVPSWATQLSRRNPDAKMLEVSLGGLKESCQAVSDRNDRLLSDIAAYARNMELLRQELKGLSETKAGLLEGHPQSGGAYFSVENEKFLRSEIDHLSGEVGSLSEDKIGKVFRSKRSALVSSIEKNKKDIKNKEADLSKMNRQYEKPLKKADSLKAEQIRLKLKVEELQDKLKRKLGESGKVGRFLSRKDKKGEERLSQLSSDLIRLRLYRQELTKDILKKVQGVSSGDFNHEGALLERRINALKEENAVLKKEVMAIRGF